MSSSSSNEEPTNQELDRLRDLNNQYRDQASQAEQHIRELQQEVDELRMEQQIRSSLQSPLSPTPAQNLQAAMSSVAPLEKHEVQKIITDSQDAFRIEIKQLLDNQFSTLTHLIQSAPSGPLTSPTPLGTASLGIPGLPASPIAAVLAGVTSNPTGILNDYDKAVEVEQRKLSNPVLTPPAIREWKLSFDVYANNPNRRMSMYEAFGK
jgi:hypothetical protein